MQFGKGCATIRTVIVDLILVQCFKKASLFCKHLWSSNSDCMFMALVQTVSKENSPFQDSMVIVYDVIHLFF